MTNPQLAKFILPSKINGPRLWIDWLESCPRIPGTIFAARIKTLQGIKLYTIAIPCPMNSRAQAKMFLIRWLEGVPLGNARVVVKEIEIKR